MVKELELVVVVVIVVEKLVMFLLVVSIVNKNNLVGIVVIFVGKFKMGDINGNGLVNECLVVEKIIVNLFVM